MTCRCSSGEEHARRAAQYAADDARAAEKARPATPDASQYTIKEVVVIGNHLVLKVEYPNCKACSYEGMKVMVFLNVSTVDALKWRKLDPHFRDPKARRGADEAPGPDARFPGSDKGWENAKAFAALMR